MELVLSSSILTSYDAEELLPRLLRVNLIGLLFLLLLLLLLLLLHLFSFFSFSFFFFSFTHAQTRVNLQCGFPHDGIPLTVSALH